MVKSLPRPSLVPFMPPYPLLCSPKSILEDSYPPSVPVWPAQASAWFIAHSGPEKWPSKQVLPEPHTGSSEKQEQEKMPQSQAVSAKIVGIYLKRRVSCNFYSTTSGAPCPRLFLFERGILKDPSTFYGGSSGLIWSCLKCQNKTF